MWYDFYPSSIVEISSVGPGDVIEAKVVGPANGYGTYTISITDKTRDISIVVSATGGSNLGAEWTIERPGSGVYGLANFGSVTFSSCILSLYHNGETVSGPIANFDRVIQSTMVDQSGNIIAATSNLSNDGTSFTVTWENSQ